MSENKSTPQVAELQAKLQEYLSKFEELRGFL
jgi:hypothetical protein